MFDKVPGLDTVMTVTRFMRNDQSADANDVDLKQLHETLVHIRGFKLHEYLRVRGIVLKRDDCMQVSRNCTVCLQHKKNYNLQSVTINVDYGSYSFQCFRMDCVGPLPPCDYLNTPTY